MGWRVSLSRSLRKSTILARYRRRPPLRDFLGRDRPLLHRCCLQAPRLSVTAMACSTVVFSWWLTALARSRSGRILRTAVAATCAVIVVIISIYLPRREVRECAGDSLREAAAQINRVVGPSEPLYLFQFEDEPAPLLFYLNRTAPRIRGRLGDAPPGYVITTAEAWAHLKAAGARSRAGVESYSGRPRLVLLRRGKASPRANPHFPINRNPHSELAGKPRVPLDRSGRY